MLGDVIRHIDDKTSIFIISDHGFGSQRKEFYLNRWFYDMGLLRYDKKRLLLSKIIHKSKFVHNRININILRRSGFSELWGGVIPDSHGDGYIDWSKTKAYCGHPSEQAIYINLKGREKKGVVTPGSEYEELIGFIKEGLLKIIDNETGKRIIDKVYKREDIYSGPYVRYAPDLFVIPKDYNCPISPFISLRKRDYLAKISSPVGYHRRNGVFIAIGRDIKRGKIIFNTSILDITPTILYLMGIPIPDDMDGKVVTDIFEDDLLATNQIRYAGAGSNDPFNKDIYGAHIYTEGEKDEIQDSLKGLGYL
jgi:predicted AlkP superfamily phosphohydrolase/phosphomutase